MAEHFARIRVLQQASGSLVTIGHDDAPPVKGAAALVQGPGHIGEGLFGMRAQMRSQPGAGIVQRRAGAADRVRIWNGQSLSSDAVGSGASSTTQGHCAPYAQRIHARPARVAPRGQSASRSFTWKGSRQS